MGIEYSYFSTIGRFIKSEELIEQKPDGTIITTRSNPYVSIAIISSVTLIMVKYVDKNK